AGAGVEGPDLVAGGDVLDGGGGAVGEEYGGAGQEAVGGAGDAVLVLLVLALVLLGALLALPLGAGALGVGQEPGDLSSPQAGDVGDDVRGDLGGRAAVLALAPVLTGLVGNQDTARAERGAEEPVVHVAESERGRRCPEPVVVPGVQGVLGDSVEQVQGVGGGVFEGVPYALGGLRGGADRVFDGLFGALPGLDADVPQLLAEAPGLLGALVDPLLGADLLDLGSARVQAGGEAGRVAQPQRLCLRGQGGQGLRPGGLPAAGGGGDVVGVPAAG